jgi:formylglycine-generating enzyme required for sulfatase activity
MPAPIPKLLSFTFQTVRLDKRGKEQGRRTSQAEYFAEDLGDGVSLEMVSIPGGMFKMGSPPGDVGDFNEIPQHSVKVSPFFIGRFEVTREQWRQVARWPKVKVDLWEDPANFKDSGKQPVEQISWEEAAEFCARLQKKTGRTYRLPTEAEWEYQ